MNMPKTIKVYCNTAGINLDDYGLFNKKYAHGEVNVPAALWTEYLEARYRLEALQAELCKLKMKKLKK